MRGASQENQAAYDVKYFESRYEDLSSQRQVDELLLGIVPIDGSERVLDLGCGLGHLLAKLSGSSDRALGVELSEYAALRAHEHGQVLLADVERGLPFRDRVFDVVFAKDVVEHIGDLEIVMRELKRITRPDGRIVIVTPNFLAIKNLISLMFGYKHPSYFDPTHVWFFSYIDMSELTQGFRILVKTTNWIVTPKTRGWFRRFRILDPLGDSLLLVLGKEPETTEI